MTNNKLNLRKQISQHVINLLPGCKAEFCGKVGQGTKERSFGFRVKDQRTGKYKSNIVWVDSNYDGEVNEAWVKSAIKDSNG